MVATGLAIAGLLAGAYGAKKQADAQKKAAQAAAGAAQFNPYSYNGTLGNVNFGSNAVSADLTGQQTDQQNLLNNLFTSRLSGQSPTSGYQDFSNSIGNSALPGLFGDALNTSNNLPIDAYGLNQGILQGLGNQSTNLASYLTGQAGSNPYLGVQNQLFGQAQGLFGGANNYFQQAGNAVNTDVSGLINNRLGLLRQQAAPQEEQQLNDLQQRLFSQGRLGSTGGGLEMEAFARGLGQADLARQLSAQDLGLQAQNQSLNNANFFGNLGGQLGNLGTNALSQAQGFGGLDLNRMLGSSANVNSLLGLSGNLSNQGFTNASSFSDMGNTRAQQRLQNAMSLFGFGNDLNTQDYNTGLSALQGSQSIDTNLRNLIALAGNLGSAQANAGANVGQALLTNSGSPFGSLLAGLGSGLFAQSQKTGP